MTTEEPRVVEDGDRVTIDIPVGTTYAALGLRVEGDEEAVHRGISALAGAFAEVVTAYNDHRTAGLAEVTIVHGPEAVAAFDIASRQTAAALGLEREEHQLEPDREQLADHLRRTHLIRTHGPDATPFLRWDQLKDSERGQWLAHADAAVEFMGSL